MEILTDFEKVLGQGEPVNFEIKGSDGELKKVSKEEFANWIENGKNVEVLPKKSLVYGVKGNIDGLTYFMERKGKDGVIKESYHEPRSEEEKKQIIERNKKQRELEKSQAIKEEEINKTQQKQQDENKEEEVELKVNQQNLSQKPDNNKNVYYRIGVVSLILLVISMVVVWVKKKKNKR